MAETAFENERGKMLLRSGVLVNFTISIMLVWVMGIFFVSICSLFLMCVQIKERLGVFFFIATIFLSLLYFLLLNISFIRFVCFSWWSEMIKTIAAIALNQ